MIRKTITRKTMTIPIFPLPIFLLPEGITRLKIFEPRYLHMVKIATKENGFAILSQDKNNLESVVASWVDIINFDQTNEGVLQIDVQCKSLVSLTNLFTDKNHLMWGNAKSTAHWQPHQHNELTLTFAKMLQDFFEQHDELYSLYNNNFINKPNWVLSRWLELLPVNNASKANFLLPNSYSAANNFLSSVLLTKN